MFGGSFTSRQLVLHVHNVAELAFGDALSLWAHEVTWQDLVNRGLDALVKRPSASTSSTHDIEEWEQPSTSANKVRELLTSTQLFTKTQIVELVGIV